MQSDYIDYYQAHPSERHCKMMQRIGDDKTKSLIIPDDVKAISALHTRNLTSLFPVFDEDIQWNLSIADMLYSGHLSIADTYLKNG